MNKDFHPAIKWLDTPWALAGAILFCAVLGWDAYHKEPMQPVNHNNARNTFVQEVKTCVTLDNRMECVVLLEDGTIGPMRGPVVEGQPVRVLTCGGLFSQERTCIGTR
jgi:hypothetical protein